MESRKIETKSPTSSPESEDLNLRERLEREALLRVAAAAAGASALEDVLDLAAEEAMKVVGAASLSVSRFHRTAREIQTILNVGNLGPGEVRNPQAETYCAAGDPLVRDLIDNGQPYFNDIASPDCDPGAAALLRKLGKASDVGVAITVDNEVWGEVWATRGGDDPPFDARDATFLEAISGQFAVAIARAELFTQVSRLAYEDALTGLPNRRAFDERMERMHDAASLRSMPVSILICDLDGLKQINDGEGHEAGDQALRSVAHALVAVGSEYPDAFVARLGGDEFCVVLEDHDLASVVKLGANALDELKGAASGRVSISCGAAWSGSDPSSRTTAELLKDADTALYIAKRRGGGRVCSTDDNGGPQPDEFRLEDADPVTTMRNLATATNAVVADLDGELARAPALDRLEHVARIYTRAGNFAYWFISRIGSGDDSLLDLSAGDNREHEAEPVRVSSGGTTYLLADFPATERVVRAGSGSFLIERGDESSDFAERALLKEVGFDSVLAATAATSDAVYLVELYGDVQTYSPQSLVIPLRLAVNAAIPPVRPLA